MPRRSWLAAVLAGALLLPLTVRAQNPAPARTDLAEHHEFVIAGFRTEGGTTLPEARIVYGTYGHLNAARDNAVLLPSHYMADHHGYEWLIGPAVFPTRARLPGSDRLFGNALVVAEQHARALSWAASIVSIRDNVQRTLLVDGLHVTCARSSVSRWARRHSSERELPRLRRSHRRHGGHGENLPHGVMQLEGQLRRSRTRRSTAATTPAADGLSAFAAVWGGWLYSQEWWRRDLWRTMPWADATLETSIENFRGRFIRGGDANNLILQMRTWERHDVSTTPGFDGNVEHALKSIRVPLLYMPSETDLSLPIARMPATRRGSSARQPRDPVARGDLPAPRATRRCEVLNETIGAFLSTPVAPGSMSVFQGTPAQFRNGAGTPEARRTFRH
jgi:homoserine O-acetyltransferase